MSKSSSSVHEVLLTIIACRSSQQAKDLEMLGVRAIKPSDLRNVLRSNELLLRRIVAADRKARAGRS